MVVTDELIAELQQLAGTATPGPWEAVRRTEVEDITFWLIQTEAERNGWELAEFRTDVPHHSDNAAYVAKANPATILSLLAHIAELKREAERYRFAKNDTSAGKSDICIVKKLWGDGRTDTHEIFLTGEEADAAIDSAMQENPS